MPKPSHFITARLPDPADNRQAFWRHVLLRDAELYRHAKAMLMRTKNDASQFVIITAMQQLKNDTRSALGHLGGLMGEW